MRKRTFKRFVVKLFSCCFTKVQFRCEKCRLKFHKIDSLDRHLDENGNCPFEELGMISPVAATNLPVVVEENKVEGNEVKVEVEVEGNKVEVEGNEVKVEVEGNEVKVEENKVKVPAVVEVEGIISQK